MKKQLLILGFGLLGLTSCQKEKEEIIEQPQEYHTVRFVVGTDNGFCRITHLGIIKEVEPYNYIAGGPEHQCVSGDRLYLRDEGYDILPNQQVYMECYIIVDNKIVREYSGGGVYASGCVLEYTIP